MAGRIAANTERALERVRRGERVSDAARIEGVDRSTIFRQLNKVREADPQIGVPCRFVIVGAGGFGRELRQWMLCDRIEQRIVFLDDRATGPDVIGTIDSYERVDGDQVLIAIGDPRAKHAAGERFKTLGRFIASTAVVGDCKMAEGVIISPHAIVSTGTSLGIGTHLNLAVTIGHDAQIGNWCQLSPHVGISGWVKVGERCFFGTGAQVIPKVQIGNDVTVGAGAVVTKDVPDGATVVGVPARRIK